MDELIGLVAVAAPFLMVVGIVWITSRAKLESKRLNTTAHESAEKAAQYANNIQALRDQRAVEERDSGVPLESVRKERV